jgi:hypothetical protein
MSEDFGTVSIRSGARSREIEILREHYRTHREALVRMAAEAPTEHLAAEYTRLIAGIDASLRKLDELEGRAAAAAPPPSSPGSRPLVMTPGEPAASAGRYDTSPGTGASSTARAALIVLAGLVVLGAIAWLIWRASSERKTTVQRPAVVEQPGTTLTAPAETGTVVPAVTPAPAASASLRVSPAVQDFGIIRRGTRAVRQFEVINSGTIPLTLEVVRSACRCLYYDYNNKKIAPNAHETITVAVDAARAKSQVIDEQIVVKAKEDPSASATFVVRATIK